MLVGFMGAGKTTLGPALAGRLGRQFVAVDDVVEERASLSVATIFSERGEDSFRALEEEAVLDVLSRREPAVVELGGGGLGSEATRAALEASAFALLLDVDVDEAWRRVENGDRPLAQDGERFRDLYAERRRTYEAAADARADDLDGAVLACAGVRVESGAIASLATLVPGAGPIALVADERVVALHGAAAAAALGERVAQVITVAQGEAAKTTGEAGRLWSALRLDRAGTVVSLGGGSTSDLAGFVASAYLRGVAWVPVATTLVGQVDAAIGGKTGVDVPEGKNLVGAFHWPCRVVCDPDVLATLTEAELRNGRAEMVKTGLLAGEPVWERPLADQVRSCAAFKAGVCLRDPLDLGPRNQLNLGHTFAHALEAGTEFALPHGEAVALGLLAALELSERHCGLDPAVRDEVKELLTPAPVRADLEIAWDALRRDKKASGGSVRLVLLETPGNPVLGVELPDDEVRDALRDLVSA